MENLAVQLVIKNGVFPGKDKNGSSKSQTSQSSESLTKSMKTAFKEQGPFLIEVLM